MPTAVQYGEHNDAKLIDTVEDTEWKAVHYARRIERWITGYIDGISAMVEKVARTSSRNSRPKPDR